MKHLTSILLGVFLLAGLAGCAATKSEGARKNPDQITQEEIASSGIIGSAYTLVQNLRPLWLRRRGRHSITNESSIWVYVDGTRFGAPESLGQLSVVNVSSLEFLSAAEATNRYGMGHDHGAIFVRMKN